MEPAENYYELLEVKSTASFEEVQKAYEKKLEEVHEESLASYSLCPVDENEELLKNSVKPSCSWLILKPAEPMI